MRVCEVCHKRPGTYVFVLKEDKKKRLHRTCRKCLRKVK